MANQTSMRLDGLQGFNALINTVRSVTDPEEFYDTSSAIMLNRIRTRFRDAVDPSGAPWPESQAAKDRAAQGINQKTLFDTGKLFHSLQAYRDNFGYAIGTDVKYGLYHQEGRGQAKRVFLGWSDDDALTLKSIAVTFLRRKVANLR